MVKNDEIGRGPRRDDAIVRKTHLTGRRRRADGGGVDKREPHAGDQRLERPVHRDEAAGDRAVAKKRCRFARDDRLAAERAHAPGRSPATDVASVIAMTRDGPLARIAVPTTEGWTCTPSQISSAATASEWSTAPASPGVR